MRYQLVGAGKGSAPRDVDSERYESNYERIFGKKPLPNEKQDLNRGKVRADRYSTLDNPESSISRMMKDRTMVRMIREGKAEDRGLKREAEHIERENTNRPKEMFRNQQLQKLQAARFELRRSQR